ncbi:MAG: hypothetical protein HQL69_06905 [Magnetococcales bacterium]|nr:hypothetical protein [Magnetococcales bacterium]
MDLSKQRPKRVRTSDYGYSCKTRQYYRCKKKHAEQDKPEYDQWAKEQIQEGLEAIKSGDIVSDDDLKVYFKKRGIDG